MICGDGKVDLAGTGVALERSVSETAFNQSEKCTWVMSSTTKAPTFKISTPTVTSIAAILPATYDLIYQEWVEGWNGFEQASLTNNDHSFGTAFVFAKSSLACAVTAIIGTNDPDGCIEIGTVFK